MKKMTKSQKRVYDYFIKCREKNQPTPTLRELAEHFGWNTSGMAQTLVNSMIEAGFITHVKGTARSFICVPLETSDAS